MNVATDVSGGNPMRGGPEAAALSPSAHICRNSLGGTLGTSRAGRVGAELALGGSPTMADAITSTAGMLQPARTTRVLTNRT
jgi:hypothetical protein